MKESACSVRVVCVYARDFGVLDGRAAVRMLCVPLSPPVVFGELQDVAPQQWRQLMCYARTIHFDAAPVGPGLAITGFLAGRAVVAQRRPNASDCHSARTCVRVV